MLSIFGRVEGRFCQDEDRLLGVAPQVVKHTSMPILFHQVPIPDNTSFDRIDYLLRPCEVPSLLSDNKIESLCDFFIAHGPARLPNFVPFVCDECRDVKGGLCIASIAHFGVSCSIVDDDHFGIDIH